MSSVIHNAVVCFALHMLLFIKSPIFIKKTLDFTFSQYIFVIVDKKLNIYSEGET